jgi:hypothetical protein
VAPGENQPARNQCRPGARKKISAWSSPKRVEPATSINADFQEHRQGSSRRQRTIGVLSRTGKTPGRHATTSLSTMSRNVLRLRPISSHIRPQSWAVRSDQITSGDTMIEAGILK